MRGGCERRGRLIGCGVKTLDGNVSPVNLDCAIVRTRGDCHHACVNRANGGVNSSLHKCCGGDLCGVGASGGCRGSRRAREVRRGDRGFEINLGLELRHGNVQRISSGDGGVRTCVLGVARHCVDGVRSLIVSGRGELARHVGQVGVRTACSNGGEISRPDIP